MDFYIGVKQFGKIEEAEINIGDLTMFVGENNTGKSLMMQLICIVMSEIRRVMWPLDPKFNMPVKGVTKDNDIYSFEADWFKAWEGEFNSYLEENKDGIIEHYFRKSIPIEDLYVRIQIQEGEKYYTEKRDEQYSTLYYKKSDQTQENIQITSYLLTPVEDNEYKRIEALGSNLIMEVLSLSRFWPTESIYLPASRTGLQLLYRYFFSEKDKMSTINPSWYGESKPVATLGLTLPVYNYLQFLLRYNKKPTIDSQEKSIIDFINQKLLDGRIDVVWDEDVYIPRGERRGIPFYLSSSMVNEVAPIIKVLTSEIPYKYVYYDEIETCLHPLKQGEMARVILRMVNAGRKMVISTHSDTMASKLNNLFILSNKEDDVRKKLLKKLKLNEEDILKGKSINVYEFKLNKSNSSVEQLNYTQLMSMGYDFGLFSQNIDQIYDETEIIISGGKK